MLVSRAKWAIQSQRPLFAIGVLVGFISACSVAPYGPKEAQDGPPLHTIDVSTIPDATPKPVVRTRAGNPPTYTVFGKSYRVMADSKGYQERGLASWYGTKFHGRKTSNGEAYDMFAMTAAHKTLPIPSYVRVTRLSSRQSIVVRINDRGPFKDGRVIDLSYAAAKKLGVDRDGVAWVDVVDVTPMEENHHAAVPAQGPSAQLTAEPVEAAPSQHSPNAVSSSLASPGNSTANDNLYLQLGAFHFREMAISLQQQIQQVVSAPVTVIEGEDSLHRVKLGPSHSRELLLAWQRILKAKGLASGFIVRL